MENINLGIIGLSIGNGHPYSWSAICNGYNPVFMKKCPFPVIYDYLENQKFPEDRIKNAEVTHVWTENLKISEDISKCSNIKHIVNNIEDLIGKVDGILLARDDYNNHLDMAIPFLNAGLPIFIDKPICTRLQDLYNIYTYEQYPGQIFTCSSLRYAKEFALSSNTLNNLGKICHSTAIAPKSWDKYSIHVIQPLLKLIGNQGRIKNYVNSVTKNIQTLRIEWESGHYTEIKTLGDLACPFKISLFGEKNHIELQFSDTFFAFKKSIESFLESIVYKKPIIEFDETKLVIELVELGLKQ